MLNQVSGGSPAVVSRQESFSVVLIRRRFRVDSQVRKGVDTPVFGLLIEVGVDNQTRLNALDQMQTSRP